MANFTNPSPGGHVNGEELFAEEFDPVAAALPKLANFSDGSSHEPSSPVIVRGDGMDIDPLTFIVRGNPTVEGAIVPMVIPATALVPGSPENWGRSVDYISQDVVQSLRVSAYATVIVPSGTTLSAVTAYIKGNPHTTWPPEYLPVVRVYKSNIATGSRVLVAGPTEYAGDQATYEDHASIDVDGIAASPDRTTASSTEHFVVQVSTEAGANAVDGFRIYGALVLVAPNKMFVP